MSYPQFGGLPPELDGSWLEIGVVFFLPVICGVALEGTLPIPRGFMFLLGLTIGVGAAFVVMVVKVVNAHKVMPNVGDLAPPLYLPEETPAAERPGLAEPSIDDTQVVFRSQADSTTQTQEFGFFVIGLIGIIATGVIVGMGGDMYWGLAAVGSFGGSDINVRGHLLLFTLAALAGLFDLIGFGVMFAGAVIVVQRLRGAY